MHNINKISLAKILSNWLSNKCFKLCQDFTDTLYILVEPIGNETFSLLTFQCIAVVHVCYAWMLQLSAMASGSGGTDVASLRTAVRRFTSQINPVVYQVSCYIRVLQQVTLGPHAALDHLV